MKRGFFVGMILTVTRIFRCNPFCPGGYDPVPFKGFRNNKDAANRNIEDDGEDKEGFSFEYDLSYIDPQEKSNNEKTKRED